MRPESSPGLAGERKPGWWPGGTGKTDFRASAATAAADDYSREEIFG